MKIYNKNTYNEFKLLWFNQIPTLFAIHSSTKYRMHLNRPLFLYRSLSTILLAALGFPIEGLSQVLIVPYFLFLIRTSHFLYHVLDHNPWFNMMFSQCSPKKFPGVSQPRKFLPQHCSVWRFLDFAFSSISESGYPDQRNFLVFAQFTEFDWAFPYHF